MLLALFVRDFSALIDKRRKTSDSCYSDSFCSSRHLLHVCLQRKNTCFLADPNVDDGTAVEVSGLETKTLEGSQDVEEQDASEETIPENVRSDKFVGLSHNVVDDWLHRGEDLNDMTLYANACYIKKVAKSKLNATTQFDFEPHYAAAASSVQELRQRTAVPVLNGFQTPTKQQHPEKMR